MSTNIEQTYIPPHLRNSSKVITNTYKNYQNLSTKNYNYSKNINNTNNINYPNNNYNNNNNNNNVIKEKNKDVLFPESILHISLYSEYLTKENFLKIKSLVKNFIEFRNITYKINQKIIKLDNAKINEEIKKKVSDIEKKIGKHLVGNFQIFVNYFTTSSHQKEFKELYNMINDYKNEIDNLINLKVTAREISNNVKSPFQILFTFTELSFLVKESYTSYQEKYGYVLYFKTDYVEMCSTFEFNIIKDLIKKLFLQIELHSQCIINKYNLILEIGNHLK